MPWIPACGVGRQLSDLDLHGQAGGWRAEEGKGGGRGEGGTEQRGNERTRNLVIRSRILLGTRLERPHSQNEEVELVGELGLEIPDLSTEGKGA